jgi:enoyl-CoA hydratase/carnithine racemase
VSAAAPLRHEVDARGVAHLTLDRPDKGNCYNQPMLDTLAAAIARAAADPAARRGQAFLHRRRDRRART